MSSIKKCLLSKKSSFSLYLKTLTTFVEGSIKGQPSKIMKDSSTLHDKEFEIIYQRQEKSEKRQTSSIVSRKTKLRQCNNVGPTTNIFLTKKVIGVRRLRTGHMVYMLGLKRKPKLMTSRNHYTGLPFKSLKNFRFIEPRHKLKLINFSNSLLSVPNLFSVSNEVNRTEIKPIDPKPINPKRMRYNSFFQKKLSRLLSSCSAEDIKEVPHVEASEPEAKNPLTEIKTIPKTPNRVINEVSGLKARSVNVKTPKLEQQGAETEKIYLEKTGIGKECDCALKKRWNFFRTEHYNKHYKDQTERVLRKKSKIYLYYKNHAWVTKSTGPERVRIKLQQAGNIKFDDSTCKPTKISCLLSYKMPKLKQFYQKCNSFKHEDTVKRAGLENKLATNGDYEKNNKKDKPSEFTCTYADTTNNIPADCSICRYYYKNKNKSPCIENHGLNECVCGSTNANAKNNVLCLCSHYGKNQFPVSGNNNCKKKVPCKLGTYLPNKNKHFRTPTNDKTKVICKCNLNESIKSNSKNTYYYYNSCTKKNHIISSMLWPNRKQVNSQIITNTNKTYNPMIKCTNSNKKKKKENFCTCTNLIKHKPYKSTGVTFCKKPVKTFCTCNDIICMCTGCKTSETFSCMCSNAGKGDNSDCICTQTFCKGYIRKEKGNSEKKITRNECQKRKNCECTNKNGFMTASRRRKTELNKKNIFQYFEDLNYKMVKCQKEDYKLCEQMIRNIRLNGLPCQSFHKCCPTGYWCCYSCYKIFRGCFYSFLLFFTCLIWCPIFATCYFASCLLALFMNNNCV